MTLGYATRETIMLKGGKKALSRAKASFPAMSLLGMYAIIFLIFMEQSQMIVGKWKDILIALAPLSLYYAITLLIFTFVNVAIKIRYSDHMALTFTASGKNEGTAMAIALGAGIGLAAIPAALTPLLQIPFLVTYMKLCQHRKFLIKNTEKFCAFSSVKFEHFHRLFLTSLTLSYRFFAFLSICNFSHVCLLSPNGEATCQVKRMLLPHLRRSYSIH
jgi:hypothetical protein